ncbi:hypothetical protein AURDEDRAFT_173515 [Auricularia subglabra TFB-10046 SS5]|nr:hypothetical protein AURDEDRAFT_173515 [Auricularia subglabra TFB-10046 SS5]
MELPVHPQTQFPRFQVGHSPTPSIRSNTSSTALACQPIRDDDRLVLIPSASLPLPFIARNAGGERANLLHHQHAECCRNIFASASLRHPQPPHRRLCFHATPTALDQRLRCRDAVDVADVADISVTRSFNNIR